MKQAMLLCAGRGSRLAPLTDTTPKPLLQIGAEIPLLRHLRRFAAAGVQRVVINLHHLGEQIRAQVGDGSAYGVEVCYSPEAQLLGSAGGIRWAMAQGLLSEPFALANGDVVCDYEVAHLPPPPPQGCHLLLVANPPAHPRGDFSLCDGKLTLPAAQTYTYAGIGTYDPALFADLPAGAPGEMLPLLHQAIDAECATAEVHRGIWHDIGTPDALAAARAQFNAG